MADSTTPSQDRLLAIIELQNVIAAAALPADEVMRLVTERGAAMVGAASATLELVEGDDMVCRAAHGAPQALGMRRSQKSTLSGKSVAERKALKSDDGTAIVVPMLHGEYVVGVLGAAGGTFTAAEIETLKLLAQIISIPLHRNRSFPRPKYDNTHDALTGLLNRRAFEDRVGQELARRTRYGQSFSLAFLDLDGFNTANDRFGEAAGDELLRSIGTVLVKHTRVMDACFRLGGDEFAIVMPGTGFDGAKILAERFRQQIADAKICDGTVTASIGVVEAVDETLEALVDRADGALRADKAGRRPS